MAADWQLHSQSVRPQVAPLSDGRRSRVHGNGLSAHSRSTAGRICSTPAGRASQRPQVASAWRSAQLHLRSLSSQQVDGEQQPAQLHLHRVSGSECSGLTPALAGSTSAGRERTATAVRPQVASAWQRPLSSQQVDSRPHLQYARRPRLSASAGRECMAISAVAPAVSQLTAGRRRATTSAVAPASR